MKYFCSIFSKDRARLPKPLHATPHTIADADSEATLIAFSHSSIPSRVARSLKNRAKAAGVLVLAKVRLVSPPTDKNESSLEQPATSNANHVRYKPVRLLGRGGNGDVHLCRDTKMGSLVAVKTIYHGPSRTSPDEAHILRLLGQHEHIVWFHTFLNHPYKHEYKQLVFECCELGDLAAYMDAMPDDIPEMFAWHVFKHVTAGLHHIHSSGIVHGDLKPANILLAPARDGESYPLLKIADFGTATINPPKDIPLGHSATLGYQPPEAEWRYGPECDVWALGCIIHELAAWKLPIDKLEEPAMDPETWFDLAGKSVPPGTVHSTVYKHFCHYLAFHPPAPQRIDVDHLSSDTSMVYSKLLNYMMMRTLETNYRKRITAWELHRYVLVLKTLAHNLLLSGQESMLNRFDDGRDELWRQISPVTDSSVFEQLFYSLALRTQRTWNMELVTWGKPLLEIMDAAERSASYRFVEDLVDLRQC